MTTRDHDLSRDLRLPLDALRASIEALAGDLEANDPRSEAVLDATREVDRLMRRVEELVDYSAPAAPCKARCTLDEVLQAVRAQLGPSAGERLLLARDAELEPVRTDAPLLARALRRLVEDALASCNDAVLLRGAVADGELVLTVLGTGDVRAALHGTSPLGPALAQRDVERLGGRVVHRRAADEIRTEVRVPCRVSEEAAA